MIRIDEVGWIRSGDDAGKYVRIQELPDTPPSYMILMAFDREFNNGYGDYWVEDFASLQEFFAEGEWVVEWPGTGHS
ncbi:hypothetical protein [Streptomyces sp. ME19-01-6]|uniref:hypothetical protein n=1 Tax=Streptomyces sp. ME19-01-6 TaxID=3028686 RepID=UPI0029A95233|nr:hypothetical protein [Streptomyces sp. ME19-01-6]MDX3231482.1 hypothetical protein [Streptomyces sp. ME19-01-6]